MNLKELNKILKSTGIKVIYGDGESEKVPYITYEQVGTNDIFAENINYAKFKIIRIYLYTNGKDEAKEALIENALTKNEIAFEYSDNGLIKDGVNVREIEYEVEI